MATDPEKSTADEDSDKTVSMETQDAKTQDVAQQEPMEMEDVRS